MIRHNLMLSRGLKSILVVVLALCTWSFIRPTAIEIGSRVTTDISSGSVRLLWAIYRSPTSQNPAIRIRKSYRAPIELIPKYCRVDSIALTVVPLWSIAGLLLLIIVLLPPKPRSPTCQDCGYSLVGLVGQDKRTVCPECGKTCIVGD